MQLTVKNLKSGNTLRINMRINRSIKKLWEKEFFLEHKKPNEVKKWLFEEFGITCSNILMQLKSCKKFLRKEDKGWIQKYSANELENKDERDLDYFKLLNIHPKIGRVSKKLFLDKHFAQAIFEAFKKVNNLVKEKSGRKDLDGKNLMLTVFSVNNPTLRFNDFVSQSDKDEQEGFMYLLAGATLGIRNPKGHENIIQKDIHRTLECLVFASFLCKKIEGCKKVDVKTSKN